MRSLHPRNLQRLAGVISFMLWAAAAQAAPPAGDVLRVAVHMSAVQDASRVDIETSLGVWVNELTTLLEVPSEVQFYDSLADVRRDFESDKVNFVIAEPVNLVRQFDRGSLTDGFGGGGQSGDNMIVIVRKGSGIRSTRDLAGKRVMLMAGHNVSSLLLETSCLKNFHQSCAKASVKVDEVKRSRQQILKLFFGNADAAIVRGYALTLAAELNPQILQKIETIESFPIYGGALGMFSNRVNPQFRDYVIEKAPKLADYARGRQLMSVLQADVIRRIPSTILDPVRALITEHDALQLRYGVRVSVK